MQANNISVESTGYETELMPDTIKNLSQDLLRLNSELMQYTHIASHDLQEPLRKIHIFAGMLQHSETLTGRDRTMVEKILESSLRMNQLITDLRDHSKLIRSGKMYRPVNLGQIAEKVIGDFELAIDDKHAVISIDKLPTVSAVALEMNQLFYNLIENALKFSDPLRIPEIAIRCKKMDTAAVNLHIEKPETGRTYYDISVRDNGIGLNVRYAEQIFNAFKRLHPKELYAGSGIGLSLCRNILANHGGVLFVESEPGEGSAFHIIIPE